MLRGGGEVKRIRRRGGGGGPGGCLDSAGRGGRSTISSGAGADYEMPTALVRFGQVVEGSRLDNANLNVQLVGRQLMESQKACGGEGRKEAGGQEFTAGHGLFGTGSEASRPEAVLLVKKNLFFPLRFPPTKKEGHRPGRATEPPWSSPGRHLDRFPFRNFFSPTRNQEKKMQSKLQK